MKYSINLFGYNVDSKLTVENGSIHIAITEEDQHALQNYLVRALPRYGIDLAVDESLEQLIAHAIAVEKNMTKGHMSEPRIKLPYEFQPEIKDKLIEAAELQDMSATKLLIRLIEKKYQEVMGQGR